MIISLTGDYKDKEGKTLQKKDLQIECHKDLIITIPTHRVPLLLEYLVNMSIEVCALVD
jgi:hypothetical protein